MTDKPFDPYDPKHWLSTPEPDQALVPVDHCTRFKCGNATLIKSHLGVWTCPVCLSSYGKHATQPFVAAHHSSPLTIDDAPPCDRYMLAAAVQHGLYSVWIKDGKIIMLVSNAANIEMILPPTATTDQLWQYDPKAQKWSKVTG